jgi:copper transport protein
LIRFVLLLLIALALPQQAAAHAMLLASEPADGDILAAPPGRIVLGFNEPVVPVAVRIVDADGATILGPGGARATGAAEISIDIPAPLPAGRYVVAYRVVSADTHPVAGSFVFAVGLEAADAALPEAETGDLARDLFWSGLSAAIRSLRDLALAVGCGGLGFLALFAPPDSTRLRCRLAIVALFAALATAAGVGIAGARVALAPDLWDIAVWQLGFATSAGTTAYAILIGIAVTLLPARIAPLLGLLAIATGTALTGHAATGEPRWLVTTAQTLHSLAALAWIGAFVPLFHGTARWPRSELASIGRKFSPVGIVCVVLILAAGTVLAATRLTEPADLFATDYGIVIAIKAGLFVVLLTLAADNRLNALPANPARFRRNVALELAVAVLLLVVTARLSHTPPHSPDLHAGHAVARSGPAVALVRDGNVLTLAVTGDRLDIYLADAGGAPLDPLEVEVELALPANGIAGLRRKLVRDGPGQFGLREASLSIPGRWQIGIGVLVSDFRKVTYETELRVGP